MDFRSTTFYAIPQTILMHPGNPGNAPGEADTDGVPVALHLEKARCTQLLKHLHLSLHSALFAAEVALLAWRVLAAIWVLLGNDSLLLATPQRLANTAGQARMLQVNDWIGSEVIKFKV